ncbi:DUF393 domain-containing protein [Sphingobacterium oryzagri]|uniref:DUF393 domain-containing protein n=1 Tax=Sphingobacterium oryzagri TaxID=3025669 RepID=A0ABY7WHT5_9SPHI|nr:DUF393 domain-containing protein [Sphingobacterium sp. KACC 22765]WDF69184.1 DUF393 domain-containing protein [Sphingobacterium sp. KACC 22765]
MHTLKNHLILFDAECPMCRLYTQAFVSTGMLDSNGRAAYQEFPAAACPLLDRQRAANEIALIDRKSGEVTYGIASLFKILATSFPLLKPVFLFQPFVWLMSKLYAFVSYNRRVIIPAGVKTTASEMQPSFKLRYRLAYLFMTWLFTAWILSAYAPLMSDLLPAGNGSREYLICAGQLFFQGAVISIVHPSKRWDYLGNMMTISFGGALLLLPAMFLSTWLMLPPLFYAAWFMGVAGLMFLEHIRRSKLLSLGWALTSSWVLYRILVLLFILF